MLLKLLLSVAFATYAAAIEHVHNTVETEMFAIPISPNLFNWTYQEFDQQYRFHASMENKPELPPFLRYIYSGRHHSGFIFGTPPRGIKSPIRLQIVGLNREDYETRRVTIVLNITPKSNMARHEVAFKIDNLNVEDLLDEHKMTRLKDILRTKLWTESTADLYPTFLASAIDLGARLPLRPGDGEGLVVRLGSTQPFSTELKRLREEVRPLSRLPSCPREYKRTTVERLFRDAGLTLDWCQFELYNTIYTERATEHVEYLTEPPNQTKDHRQPIDPVTWNAPSKHALPLRSYTKHLVVTIAAPMVLLMMCVAALTAVLCFHYAGVRDSESEWFLSSIFHICTDSRNRQRVHNPSNVEICRYGTNVTEQTQLGENDSRRSVGPSPNNSIGKVRSYSPKSNTNLTADYIRPQPPPYMGGGNLHHRRSGNTDRTTPSTSGHTPEHRGHLALEESLQLLNEAKISTDFDPMPILKDPVIDYADTTEDYVPVQPEISGLNLRPDISALNPMLADLDDINVPELSKYGIGAQI